MLLETFKDWLTPLSTAIGVLSAVIAIFVAVREYRLKSRAETRLAEAATIESDIKLLTLFTQLMDIAHARGPSSLVSEKVFEVIWPQLQKAGATDPKAAAVVTMPVGIAAQDAAIAAIATLGRRHHVLRPAAVRALQSLSSFKADVVKPFLDELQLEA